MNRNIINRFNTIISLLLISSFLVAARQKSITILYTNDIHANFLPHNPSWQKVNKDRLIGGFNELCFAVDSIRKIRKQVFLFDAGDIMTGTPITEYEFKHAKGGALFEMMNLIGYDACTLGNHDFDISKRNLINLIKIAKFPALCANLKDTIELELDSLIIPFKIFQRHNTRIAVIGLMTIEFHQLVNKRNTSGIAIYEPASILQRWIDSINQHVDLIVALTHQGFYNDSILATRVNGLNIIIGGHSHTRLKKPKVINGVIIVQAGKNCEYLGILDIQFDKKTIIKFRSEILPLWYNPSHKSLIAGFVDSLGSAIEKDYGEVICTLKTSWQRKHGESNVGNFIADAQREAVNADVAFMNSHGIRKNLPAGPVTKMNLFEVLPFHNILAKFELTGKQIREIMEYYISNHPPIHISGIFCKYKKLHKQIDYVEFLVNGAPLDENRTYTCTANDYLIQESKRYLGIEIANLTYLETTLFSVVEKKMREQKEISAKIEKRIERIE